jgi:hypothetical protein
MTRFIVGLVAGLIIGIAAISTAAIYLGHRDLDGWTATLQFEEACLNADTDVDRAVKERACPSRP